MSSIAMAWSVESLPSNPAVRIRFLAGSGIFNLYPDTGVMSFGCVPSCVVSGGGPDTLLTIDYERRTPVILSSVLVHSISPLTGV